MRITKKYSGASCIGKQLYIPAEAPLYDAKLQQLQADLVMLERAFMAEINVPGRAQTAAPAPAPAAVAFHPLTQHNVAYAAALQSQAAAAAAAAMRFGHQYPVGPAAATAAAAAVAATAAGYPADLLAAMMHQHAHQQQCRPALAAAASHAAALSAMQTLLMAQPGLAGGRGMVPGAYYPGAARRPEMAAAAAASTSSLSDSCPEPLPLPLPNSRPAAAAAAAADKYARLPPSAFAELSSSTNFARCLPRQRPACTSAELFGQQNPTTREQMALEEGAKDAEAARKRPLAARPDRRSFEQIPHRPKLQPSSASAASASDAHDPADLDAPSLLLNFFRSSVTHREPDAPPLKKVKAEPDTCVLEGAPALDASRGLEKKSKSSTSSGSGRTSKGSGDGDHDDGDSTFSDTADLDASTFVSGRSSSLSTGGRSDQSDDSSQDDRLTKSLAGHGKEIPLQLLAPPAVGSYTHE